MAGIVSYGSYVPYWRLKGSAIGAVLGSGGGRGTRAVASFDEDTTSMGVEAARNALAARPGFAPSAIVFSTTDPAYLDKTNATAIHAALGLPQSVFAADAVGSVRSGVGALLAAAGGNRATLAILSDIRTGLPGGNDEATGGDAAAAFAFGAEGVLAELIGVGSSTAEFVDRWRAPGDAASKQWEERFGEFEYVPLAAPAMTDALKAAGVGIEQVDHVIVGGTHPRAIGVIAKAIGAKPGAAAADLTSTIGRTGVADTPLSLVSVLDKAGAGEVIVQVSVADGVDVLVWKTTAALAGFRDARTAATLADQIGAGRDDLTYAQFLTWKGQLRREPPRRPDFERPSAPAAARNEEWKYGFVSSRCLACGARHLPPARVCVKCRTVDEMTPERLADVQGTIATFTIDRLAYSMSPPVVAAVVDFDGGGRFNCEMTDVDPATVAIGNRVEMTFRRLFTADGIHNYFWKGRPARG